jgi:hypothetical protein
MAEAPQRRLRGDVFSWLKKTGGVVGRPEQVDAPQTIDRWLIAQEGRLSLSHPEGWQPHPNLGSSEDLAVIRRASADGHILLEVFAANDELTLPRWSDLQQESTRSDHGDARTVSNGAFQLPGSSAREVWRLVMEYREPTRTSPTPIRFALVCFFLRWPGVTLCPFFKLPSEDLRTAEPDFERVVASVSWK